MKDATIHPPERLEIHPTLICNLCCAYCSLRILERFNTIGDAASALRMPLDRLFFDTKNKRSLPIGDFLKQTHIGEKRLFSLVDEAHQLGVRQFTVSGGGEPLCKTELVLELIKKMQRCDSTVELVTNGTLLKDEIISRLISIGLRILSISVDCASPEILDRRRGRNGTFAGIFKALNAAKTVKTRLNISYPRLQFYTVLDDETMPEILKLCQFAAINHVSRIQFIPRKDRSYDDIGQAHHLIKKLTRFSVETNLAELFCRTKRRENTSPVVCRRPFTDMVVHANGLVTPCCSMQWGLGEFVQSKSMEEIWRGRFFQKVRCLFEKGVLPDCCTNCKEV